MSFALTLAFIGFLVASVNGHGFVQGIVADGIYYRGYNPAFRWIYPGKTIVLPGWNIYKNVNSGFIPPASYGDPNIICHVEATPGQTSAKVAAGQIVELQWTPWPLDHRGPVVDYLAKCPGSCTNVDKTTLKFFKIGEEGLIDGHQDPGVWASNELTNNNSTWSVKIPTSIAPGNYVLRHEIIALHAALHVNGTQNYPSCINLEITSDGTDNPDGVLGTELYKADDPGILTNIYQPMKPYIFPGPTLYSGALSVTQKPVAITADAPETTVSAVSGSWSPSYIAASSPSAASSRVEAPSAASSSAAAAVATPTTTPFETLGVSASSSSVEYGATVTKHCTTTIFTVVTEYGDAPSPTISNAAAPEASPIASTTKAVPVVTSTIHSTIFVSGSPTGPHVASSTGSRESHGETWGSKPSKPLPKGWKMKDLLEWVVYLMMKPERHQKRTHGRDFVGGVEG